MKNIPLSQMDLPPCWNH